MKDEVKKFIIPFAIMIIVNLGTYYLTRGQSFGEELSPNLGLFVISGILFGPYGAVGSGLGMIVGDMIKSTNYPILITNLVTTGISYLAYKLWYGKFRSRQTFTKPRLNNTSNIILFLGIILLCDLLFVIINRKIMYILNPGLMVNHTPVGIRYFFNFFNYSFIFGVIGIWLSKKIDIFHVPKVSNRKEHPKFYHDIFILLVLSVIVVMILDNYFPPNKIGIMIEGGILIALLVIYLTKPMTVTIEEITLDSIPEMIMNFFIVTTLVIAILGVMIASSQTFITNITQVFQLGTSEVTVIIMIIIDIMLIIFFIPSLAVLRYIEHKVIDPITSFSKIEKFIKKGNKIESEGLVDVYSKYLDENNEIGMLARSYTNLIEYNNDYIENIHENEVEKEINRTQLEIAEKIQNSTLPEKSIENKEYSAYGFTKPAREVGGDFYDYYQLDEDNLVIVIGDASGKGVPAALLSVTAKAVLKQLLKYERDPSKVLYLINNQLCDNNPENVFVTLWLGIYNKKTKILTYSNAGHPAPLINKDGKFEPLKINKTVVLGFMENYEYPNKETTLSEGVVAYTDGITDARNPNKEFYGEDRLINYLNNHAFENDIITGLLKDIDEFTESEDQFDDMTILLLKMNK